MILFLAQGFGLGRLPVAPGTFGSVLGVAWALALLATRSGWGYGLGMLAALVASVGICGAAERILGIRDPGSVVWDEIAAIPLCFAGWFAWRLWAAGELPAPGVCCGWRGGLMVAAAFAAFRLFDIAKPWPVRQSQSLPGGWGVTVDDVLAALYANVVWLPFAWLGWL